MFEPPGYLRAPLTALAALLAVLAGAALAARLIPVTNHGVLTLAALSPYLSMAAVPAALLLVATRRFWAAAAAAGLAAAAIAVQLPRFIPDTAPDGVPLRILTANVELGTADAAALAALARDWADVLVLQELTPQLADAISTRIAADFPHRALDARPHASGAGVWSRYPITDTQGVGGFQLATQQVRLAVPGAAEVTLLNTHIVGPWPQPIDGWRTELALMRDTMTGLAAEAGPVIVVGDFNATRDMDPFRALLSTGFGDAADQSGAGLARTFPADSPVPPLIGIDHILIRHALATDARTVRVPGSDHLGVVATVVLRPLV
jgi:endonuclease/exonuclease/phosphatase (EEP) superfamily protein YafD